MAGLIIFFLAAVVCVALVVFRSRRDLGKREHRELDSQGIEIWEWFAGFERQGGYVQDLEGIERLELLRSAKIPWRASNQLILSISITAFAYVLQWSMWVPLLIVFVLITAVTLIGEYLTFYVNKEVDSWRYEGRVQWLVIGILIRTSVLDFGLAAMWLGASAMADDNWILALTGTLIAVVAFDTAHLPARSVEILLRNKQQITFAQQTPENAILYLRSFDDDVMKLYAPAGPGRWYTPLLPQSMRFEELIETWTFGLASTVVAIGRPGEARPTLGADRTYWTNETWQDAVRLTAARCRIVILVAGTSEGLQWEISQLRAMDVLKKTLILLPPDSTDNSALRYDRILSASGHQGDTLIETPLALQSIPALGFTPEGELVHYISFGRDWSSYVAAQTHLINTLVGAGFFEEAGVVGEIIALTEDQVAIAHYFYKTRQDVESAKQVLDDIEMSDIDQHEHERIVVARAALDLASGVPPTCVAKSLDPITEQSDVLAQAVKSFSNGRVSADTLFQIVLPHIASNTSAKPPREVPSGGISRKMASRLNRIRLLHKMEQYELVLKYARAMHELASSARLTLAAALAQVLAAEAHSQLGQEDQTRQLCLAVINQQLPSSTQLGRETVQATEVKERAFGMLQELEVQTSEERRASIQQEFEYFQTQQLRRETADAALKMSSHYLKTGEPTNAQPWAGTARKQFEALGLVEQQVEAITHLARAALEVSDYKATINFSDEALSLATDYGFNDLSEESKYLLACAETALALEANNEIMMKSAVLSIEQTLTSREKVGLFDGRDFDLVARLASLKVAQHDPQGAIHDLQRMVALNELKDLPTTKKLLASKLLIARLLRDENKYKEALDEIHSIIDALPSVVNAVASQTHIQVLTTQADILIKDGQTDPALAVLRHRAELTGSSEALDHMLWISDLLMDAGRYDEAVDEVNRFIRGRSETSNVDIEERSVAVDQRNRVEMSRCFEAAKSLEDAGQYHEAAGLFRTFRENFTSGGTYDDRRFVGAKIKEGSLLLRTDDDAEGLELLMESVQEADDRLTEPHQLAIDALKRMAHHNEETNDLEESLEALVLLQDRETAISEVDGEAALGTSTWIADILTQLGRHAEALAELERAQKLAVDRWGQNSAMTQLINTSIDDLAAGRQ